MEFASLLLSLLTIFFGLVGSFISTKSIRKRLDAEKQLANNITDLYLKSRAHKEALAVAKLLEKPDFTTQHTKPRNEEILKAYETIINNALQELDVPQRELVSAAIFQTSKHGRIRFRKKLAQEVKTQVRAHSKSPLHA